MGILLIVFTLLGLLFLASCCKSRCVVLDKTESQIFLLSVPESERTVKKGSLNYYYWKKIECDTYIQQIRRQFGEEPEGILLKTQGKGEDVYIVYEYSVIDLKYYFKCLFGSVIWDEESLKELEDVGYFKQAELEELSHFKQIVFSDHS